MKKNYMKPQTEVVNVVVEPIMGVTSPNAGLTDDKVNIENAESRDYYDWDE